jgi:FlaG/FlaF family flagellin (archaellin)
MPSPRPSAADRGLSPVVGGALLLAITVLLVSVSAVMAFGLAEDKPPAPTANFQLEHEAAGQYVLEVTDGETIDGDRLTLVGVADPDTLSGAEVVAGEQFSVTPDSETVRIVWTEAASDPVTYTLRTFEVDGPVGIGFGARGKLFTGSSGDVVSVAGDGGDVSTVLSSGNVEGLGSPEADVTGTGGEDLPFVTSSGAVKVVDASGEVTTVADSGDVSGNVRTSKTRLATGSWNGSPNSVFFTNQSSPESIFRATPSGGATRVATPANGAQAITGPTDIDADGDDELVFADGSQTIRYVEPSGTTTTTGQTLGSSTGIGSGSAGTLRGYAGTVVTGVDGGNDLVVVNATGNDQLGGARFAGSAPDAKQSPTTVADVDEDGSNELVYVGNDNGKLKYVDGFGGGPLGKEFLRDEDGNEIDGSTATGVT